VRARPFLVTGFEPFGGLAANPSATVARALAAERDDVDALVLPVDYARVADVLAPHLAAPRHGVILLGVAIGRSAVSLERVAINFRDGVRPDNTGFAPTSPEVVPGGPAAYFSTLPLEIARDRIAAAGINAEISLTAGAYLCNASFYLARHALDGRGTPCGFVHLPPTPDLACGATPMRLADEVQAIAELLETIEYPRD